MAFEFTLELAEKYREFRKGWRRYAEVIKELGKQYFKKNFVGVYVFGSTVRGDYRPLSDIDVAVVLIEDVGERDRAGFRSIIRKKLGDLHPFEVHIITEADWRGWYRRFVKENYFRV